MRQSGLDSMTDWHLSVFDGPVLAQGGHRIGLTPYQNALLAMTACVDGAITRSRLVSLLYGVVDGHRHRRRLSQLIYSTNRRCEYGLLEGTPRTVRLSPTVQTDLGALTSPLQPQQGPVLGEPLARIAPPFPSAAFESWLAKQRSELRKLSRGVNAEILELAWDAGDLKLARAASECLLMTAPTYERAIQLMMKILTIQEGPGQARAWLARHREQRLGGDCILDDWMASQRIGSYHESPDADRALSSAAVPFVGRSEELAAGIRLLLRSKDNWAGIFLQGEAGGGKSRFLQELQRRLVPEDCAVVPVELQLGDSFAAFSMVRLLLESAPFRAAITQLPQGDRSILEAAVHGSDDVVTGEAALERAEARQQRVFRILAELVRLIGTRLILIIDDARFLDRSSLAAISHLRRASTDFPIRVICADRCGRHEPGLSRTTIADFLGIESLMDLPPLTTEQSRQLAGHVCDTQSASFQSIERAVKLSGGNPLFLIELTKAYASVPSLNGALEPPETLERLIGATIQRLRPDTRAMLKVLAVQFGAGAFETLSAVSEMARHDLLVAVEEGREAELLTSGQSGITFRHGLMQEWIYRSLSTAERQFLHLATASYLEAQEGSSPDIAFHFHRAGVRSAAAKATLIAAEDSLQRGACPDAIVFFEMALDTSLSDEERFQVLERLSRLYSMRGNLQESLRATTSALELDSACGDPSQLWSLRIRRATAAAELGAIAPAGVHGELECILAAADRDEDTWLSALDAAVTLANSTLENSRARALLERLESRDFTTDRARCRASLIETFHLAHGCPSLASAASNRAIQIARGNSYESLLSKAICRGVIVRSWQATLDDSQIDRWRKQLTKIAADSGDLRGLWAFYVNIGTWFLDTFKVDRAYQWIREAKRITAGSFDAIMDIGLDNNLGEFYLLKNDYDAAQTHFKRAMAAPKSMRQEIHLSACAGVGYCLISKGRIREALRVDATLPSNETLAGVQSFDPSNLIQFRARILSIQNKVMDGLALVRASRSRLRTRHVSAWLKLGQVESRLLTRLEDQQGVADCVREAIATADNLGLSEVAAQFRARYPTHDS